VEQHFAAGPQVPRWTVSGANGIGVSINDEKLIRFQQTFAEAGWGAQETIVPQASAHIAVRGSDVAFLPHHVTDMHNFLAELLFSLSGFGFGFSLVSNQWCTHGTEFPRRLFVWQLTELTT
jgi:hypothetical protein